MKATPRSPPIIKKVSQWLATQINSALLTFIFLNGDCQGCGSTTLALDNSQADRYYSDSRMTQSIIKNIERKEVNNLWN